MLGGIIDNHRQSVGALANQCRGVHAEETADGIGQLQFVARNRETVGGFRGAKLFPIESRQKFRNALPLGFVQRQAEQMFGGFVVPGNLRLGIEHQHAILNGVKKRLKKITLPRQPSHHGLQPIRIELINAAGDAIKKAGAFGGHFRFTILWCHFAPRKPADSLSAKVSHHPAIGWLAIQAEKP